MSVGHHMDPQGAAVAPRSGQQGGHSSAREGRNIKTVKVVEVKSRYVLGRDIYMDRVGALGSRVLVGRIEYCSMGEKEWVEWVMLHWEPILTYVPTIILLANR